jgi:hypothetical protein
MATYTLGAGVPAAQMKILTGGGTANLPLDATDTVVFPQDVYAVRIRNESGGGYLNVTLDGSTPNPGNGFTYELFAGQHADLTFLPPPTGSGLTVKIRRVQQKFEAGEWQVLNGSWLHTVERGRARTYSVEAQINKGDDWPAVPVPLPPGS